MMASDFPSNFPYPVPDIYADQFLVLTTAFGATFSFGAIPALTHMPDAEEIVPPSFELKGVVRMSLAHAKLMTLVMKKQLKDHESRFGEIILPESVYEETGVSPEDW
jgi:hypothetical protein